jgi:nucleoside-diphosphate-sugar epimerase
VVINQLSQLPKGAMKPRKLGEYYARNDRVRREGTDNLLAAARAAGARRYIGQSFACWYAPTGGMVKLEEEPLWLDAPRPIGEAVAALKHSEDAVVNADDIEAVVLRYGTFYGPNTWYSADGEIARQMKGRQYPNIGSGEGVTSFIHIDDAADACVAFVDGGTAGTYNVVDDEPAPANDWMPVFAQAIGARPPRRVPAWLAKVVAGKGLVEWTTTCRGASNQALKRELGWRPQYESWRLGFEEALC